jgi:Uma2 family endonuclease
VGTQLHSLLQTIIAAYFHSIRKELRIRALTACRLQLNPATGRHVLPDVMVVEGPYKGGRTIVDVPAVAIEIKSPDDTFDSIIDKCFEYTAFGVANIVVVDPDSRRQFVFADNALQLVPALIPLHLPKQNIDTVLPMDRMFAELDED